MQNYGEFDYIIIGGGAAGCILANRLSADPKMKVLLLEAGIKDNWIWTKIPVGYLYCINNPRTDWCYHSVTEPGLNGRSIIYARGKGLGGSTLINAMLYVRGQAADYNRWADHTGDDSWSWNNVLPLFKSIEDYWDGASDYHGNGGEWRVEKARVHWDVLDRFRDAMVEAGIPAVDDFNRGNNFGVSAFEVNQKKGWRWNSNKAFLDPVAHRPNLKIVTGALVNKLVIENHHTYGVYFDLHGERFVASSRIETILSAGSIGTPCILQRSGIGDSQFLSSKGIHTEQHNPNVGKNLQDHLQLRCIYKVQGIKTLNQIANSFWGRIWMGLQFLLFQKGPLTMAPSQLGAFAFSNDDIETPDLEYHVQPLSLDKFGDPVHRFPAITASVCHLRPYSRGYVRISDHLPESAPQIAPCYLSDERDRSAAIAAVRLTRHITQQPIFAKYQPEEIVPGANHMNDEELDRVLGDIGTTIFHPVGTCKMGKQDDPTAVVDSRLRVIGIGGLRVVDASVMPFITSGNTSAPTMMIAERGSRMIIEDRHLATANH